MHELDATLRAHIRPGDRVHLAYGQGRPQAALNALVRVFWGTDAQLVVSGGGFVMSSYGLVAGGIARTLIGSFFGENYPTPGPHPELVRAYRERSVEFESWSLLTMVQRLLAGALHLPFLPTRSLAGSDLAADLAGRVRSVPDPFGGSDVLAVPALVPDVTILHVPLAEASGRFILAPPYGEGYLGALAARRGCIVTAERVVPDGSLPAHRVQLPAERVLGTVAAPFGAHPYGMWDGEIGGEIRYREDREFASEARAGFRDAPQDWLKRWVLDEGGHPAYLRLLGEERLDALRTDPHVGDLTGGRQTAPSERLVVAGATYIEERVADGVQTILSGVGLANLAAWLAHERSGQGFMLTTEIGMHSFEPVAGDPYLFALPTLERSAGFLGTLEVLGSLVSDPDRPCLGVYGAAEVDRTGAVNSTRLGDRWLVGSGGANDIASTAAETAIFTVADPHRLVERVSFVTSPGERARAIITDLGVLERRGDEFVLTRVPGTDDVTGAVVRFKAACGWDVPAAADVRTLTPPSQADLARLRAFDPHLDFL